VYLRAADYFWRQFKLGCGELEYRLGRWVIVSRVVDCREESIYNRSTRESGDVLDDRNLILV